MTEFLYGLDGDEDLRTSPQEVYEDRECDYCFEDVPVDQWELMEIEEWTAKPLGAFLPSGRRVVEMLCEALYEDEVSESAEDSIGRAESSAEAHAAFDVALAVLASKLTGWWQAEKLVRTLTVTWDENGEPLLDGEPMYVKREEV